MTPSLTPEGAANVARLSTQLEELRAAWRRMIEQISGVQAVQPVSRQEVDGSRGDVAATLRLRDELAAVKGDTGAER